MADNNKFYPVDDIFDFSDEKKSVLDDSDLKKYDDSDLKKYEYSDLSDDLGKADDTKPDKKSLYSPYTDIIEDDDTSRRLKTVLPVIAVIIVVIVIITAIVEGVKSGRDSGSDSGINSGYNGGGETGGDDSGGDTISGSDVKTVSIPAITENLLNVDGAETKVYNAPKCEVSSFSGSITGEDQCYTYKISTPNTGTCGVMLYDLVNGFNVSLGIYDSLENVVESRDYVKDSYTLSAVLNSGEQYEVAVSSRSNTGEYKGKFYKCKPKVDISSYSVINDSIEFNGQKNSYFFTPEYDGTYRFEIEKISSGNSVSVYIYDEDNYVVEGRDYTKKDEGVTAALSKGKKYKVTVSQRNGCDSYVLSVGHKKPVVDISAYNVINDEITFNSQVNTYTFTAPNTGKYNMQLSGMKSGVALRLYIMDEDNYILEDYSYAQLNDKIAPELTAGKIYRIGIVQKNGLGKYTLNIGVPKAETDISNYKTVNDSIQFPNQNNVYVFTPEQSGNYSFEFSNMGNEDSIYGVIYDELNYELDDEYLTDGEALTADLNAGSTYKICVCHYSGCPTYTMNINR